MKGIFQRKVLENSLKACFLLFIVLVVSFAGTYKIYDIAQSYVENKNGQALDLTTSIIMAISTVAYAILTIFLFHTTDKNTQQTTINVQQAANAQKIAYLERRLEKFYLPMESLLLKNHPKTIESNIDLFLSEQYMLNGVKRFRSHDDIREFRLKILAELHRFVKIMQDDFTKEYNMLRPFNYLACKDSSRIHVDLLEVVTVMEKETISALNSYEVGSTFTFANNKNISENEGIGLVLKKDIGTIKMELAELVNQ